MSVIMSKTSASSTLLIDPILENNTWDTISKVAKSGNASQYWNIGDFKKIIYKDQVYNVQIIGFDHDNVSNPSVYGRQKAGITFQLGTPNDPKNYGMHHTAEMNSSDTNIGGWKECQLYKGSAQQVIYTNKELLDDFYNLPLLLRKVIVPVNKFTSAGNTNDAIVTSSDRLFLLSEIEVFGTSSMSKAGEGNRYAFYANGGSTIRYLPGLSVPNSWWLRSPRSIYNTHFCFVNNGSISASVASYQSGITFAFCI